MPFRLTRLDADILDELLVFAVSGVRQGIIVSSHQPFL
jgi:hypothetical protein